jgi:DNA polymerase (family 10)
MEKITDAAVTNKVALEINASPKRFDLDWRHLKDAAHKGVRFIISPDAHRITGFQNVRYGVQLARKGCLSSDHILNCLPPEEFMAWQKKP